MLEKIFKTTFSPGKMYAIFLLIGLRFYCSTIFQLSIACIVKHLIACAISGEVLCPIQGGFILYHRTFENNYIYRHKFQLARRTGRKFCTASIDFTMLSATYHKKLSMLLFKCNVIVIFLHSRTVNL